MGAGYMDMCIWAWPDLVRLMCVAEASDIEENHPEHERVGLSKLDG